MSFLTAILLLNMEAADAFVCLSNLLNNKYLLACFRVDQKKVGTSARRLTRAVASRASLSR